MTSITCPVCRMTSWHPKDVAEGFCGRCHAWTSRPDLTDPPTGAPMTEPYPSGDPGSVNPSALRPTDWWKEYAPDELAATETPAQAAESTADLLRSYLDAVDAVAAAADVPPVGITEWPADLVDAAPITAHQAQGDVMVLPWPPSTVPSWRAAEVDAAEDVPAAGRPVDPDGSHVLIPEDPDAPGPVRYHPTGKGYTLGTLYVPLGSAARLSHREHADLLIGPGVYVLRQQRRWDPRGAAAAKD